MYTRQVAHVSLYRKALQYIVAQILGGFVAVLCVYGQYKQDLDLLTLGITAAVTAAAPAGAPAAALAPTIDSLIFSPFGPAGPLALFVTEGTILRYVFLVSVTFCLMAHPC